MRQMVVVGLLVLCTGCALGPKPWRLERLVVAQGFEIPESFAVDHQNNCVWVPNCAGDKARSWVDDGDGFISKMDPYGRILERHWLRSKPGAVLNDPKSLEIFNGKLYISDNKRILRVPRAEPGRLEVVDVGEPGPFGDLLAFNGYLYIGYGSKKQILRLDGHDRVTVIQGLPGINGLAAHNGKMFAVTWTGHEVYEIDPTGKDAPKLFGLAANFKNLDGIVILDDGTFIISDFMGNALYAISPDRRTLTHLADVESPADIVLDSEKMLLYVPSYLHEKISIYHVTRD